MNREAALGESPPWLEQIHRCAWPAQRLGQALEELGRRSRVSLERSTRHPPAAEHEAPPQGNPGPWLDRAAVRLGLEAEPVMASFGDLPRLLRGAAPALLRLEAAGACTAEGFLVLLPMPRARGRRRVRVLGPDLSVCSIALERLCQALSGGFERRSITAVEALLEKAGVSPRRRQRAARALLEQQLASVAVTGCWLLRPSPGRSLLEHLRRARALGFLVAAVAAHLLQYLLFVASWWVIGRAALAGRLEPGVLSGWVLLLASLIPLRLLADWSQAQFALRAGAAFKQRLLFGALALRPDEVRRHGLGQHLGRVIDTESMEALAMSGGFLALVAALELAVAALILSAGAAAPWHAAALAGWLALTCSLEARHFNKRRAWTRARIELGSSLLEAMVGYRTRLAQLDTEAWHVDEDRQLEEYSRLSRRLDQEAAGLATWLPRGWLLVGLACLLPAFTAASYSPARVAVSLGGILLAYRALHRLVAGAPQLADALIAWRQAAPMHQAAALAEGARVPLMGEGEVRAAGPAARAGVDTILDARDLSFSYADRLRPAVQHCSLRIRSGDRILLEGGSGEGKSTLVALLACLREPDAGLVLLHGLDRHVLGPDAWRQSVVAVPQLHENHVLTGSLAFNLLLGRGWPPRAEDLQQAEAVCRELGLGDLLARMPRGLFQMVGESGWQLSHGERSRVFMARALLQEPEILMVDESFGPLDPDSLGSAMAGVRARASTLLVVAHP